MTFEEWLSAHVKSGGEMNEELREIAFDAYEAGRNASRRPLVEVRSWGWDLCLFSGDRIIRGGFASADDAREWARTNGFEVRQ